MEDEDAKLNFWNELKINIVCNIFTKNSKYNFLDGNNQVFTKCTIENKNSIIGRQQILDNFNDLTTKTTNMNYPFDDIDEHIIISNQELKFNN